jgi:hypothetical protein
VKLPRRRTARRKRTHCLVCSTTAEASDARKSSSPQPGWPLAAPPPEACSKNWGPVAEVPVSLGVSGVVGELGDLGVGAACGQERGMRGAG